jgi:hypothetical protein
LVVPEPQQPESLRLQPGIAHHVAGGLVVLATIDLDDQPCFRTEEVREVRTHRHLPAKLPTGELPATQPRPQFQLRIRHL